MPLNIQPLEEAEVSKASVVHPAVSHPAVSPKQLAARNRSAMAKQSCKGLVLPTTNFLLTCSSAILDDMELGRLADIANLRSELLEILDRMNESSAQVALIQWFREKRETLGRGLETEEESESLLNWARRMIRGGGDVLPPPRKYDDPRRAHRIAVQNYSKRNVTAGKCRSCPQTLSRDSVEYCAKCLARRRNRRASIKKLVIDSRTWRNQKDSSVSANTSK
jgi:hypothetical protein